MSRQTASKRLLARVGTNVQKYRIERLIGVGGMAAVYAATHPSRHAVAIKFLLERYSDDPDIRRLFRREAYVANEVGHPGAVGVFDDDIDDDGCPFLVMSLLEGETVRARWERANKRLPVAEVAVLIADALDVLASAHAKGIVHRDIKPDNLFIVNDGHVRVLDFGIARRIESDGTATATGRMLGTPAFMPPEQALGERKRIGPSSDCWAVGATIFALLSGEFVHHADNSGAQLAAAATRKARSLSDVMPELPSTIVQFVDKSLAFDTANRWQSAREMHVGLLHAFGDALGSPVHDVAPVIRRELVAALSMSNDFHSDVTLRGDSRNRDDTPRELRKDRKPSADDVGSISGGVANRNEHAGDDPPTLVPQTPKINILGFRRAWAGAFSLLFVLALGSAIALRTRRSNDATLASPAESSVDVAGVPVTALPISPTCSKEAQAHYRAGLAALRGATWEVAYANFKKAVAADPTCPEAHVQLPLVGHVMSPIVEVREQFHRALSFRDALSERDRAVLDAYSAVILSEPADRVEWARRSDAMVARFPRDAQVLYLAGQAHGWSAAGVGTHEHVLELVQRALTIDPEYADVWQQKAYSHLYLGHYEEAISALDKCLEVAPSAVDCLSERIRALHASSQCGSISADARRWIANVPTSFWAYMELASALFLEGSPIDAVQMALQQARNNDTSARRDITYTHYRRHLALLRGDFAAAEELSERLLPQVRESSMVFDHLATLAFLADVRIETGRKDAALPLAEQFFRRKGALTNGFWPAAHEPFLLGIQLQRNKLALSEWRSSTDLWESGVQSSLTKRQMWAFRWGPVSDMRELADEGWRLRPNEIPSASLVAEPVWYRSRAKLGEGKLALAAGETEHAILVLKSATTNCDDLYNPMDVIRAQYWLGKAKEVSGDVAAACSAYGVVISRWGNAKPRSVTADEAKKRSKALGCKF